MQHTNVKLQLPFKICDRCGNMNVTHRTNVYYTTDSPEPIRKRDIVVSCENVEVCMKVYMMILDEITQAQSGGGNS